MLETGVDGAGTLLLTYRDTLCTLTISKMSHSWNHSELQTDKGTLRIDNLGQFAEVHLIVKGGVPENIGTQLHDNNMEYEIDAFCGLVHAGKQEDDILTWDLALQVAMVLDAARKDAGIVFPADLALRTVHCCALA